MMKLALSTTIASIIFAASVVTPAGAILPNSPDYKQAQTAAKSNLKSCKNKNNNYRINGKCILFNAISDENSEVYKRVNGNWQPVKLQMFDSQLFGRISSIQVTKFDEEWAYGFTHNKTPGQQLFRLRMSTISYNYGC